MNRRKAMILLVGGILLTGTIGAIVVFRQDWRETRLARVLGLADEHEHVFVPVRDEEGNIKYWTCPMHPSVKSKDPGQCPI